MALINDEVSVAAPSGRDAVDAAMSRVFLAIRGLQHLAGAHFYGSPGNRPTLAQMQERIDEYGTDAASLFQASGLLAQAVAVASGVVPEILPPGIDYTINADGTVTLSGSPADGEVVNG